MVAEYPREHRDHVGDERIEVDLAGLQGLAAAECEQLFRQRPGPVGGLLDLGEVAGDRGALLDLTVREPGIAEDAHQQVVEVVRDARCELPDRFGLLRLPLLLLGGPAHRHVLDHLEHEGRLAVRVADQRRRRADEDLAPLVLQPVRELARVRLVSAGDESRSILAHAGSILQVDQVADHHRAELLDRVAADGRESRVGGDDPAVEIDDLDADGRVLPDDLELREGLDLLALGIELRGGSHGGREHDAEQLERLAVVLAEPVGLGGADHAQRADDLPASEERHADVRPLPELVDERLVQPLVALRALDQQGAARAGRMPGYAAGKRLADADKLRGDTARGPQDDVGPLDQVHGRAVGSGEQECPPGDQPHHGLQIEPGRGDVALGLDDLRELVVLTQHELAGLTFADVLDHHDRELRQACGVALEHGRPGAGPEHLPVLADVAFLDVVGVAGSRHDLAVERDAAVEVRRVGDVRDSQFAELGRGVAEHLLDRDVRLDHAPVGVEAEEADRGSVEDLAEAPERLDLSALGLQRVGVAEHRRKEDREQAEHARVVFVEAAGAGRDRFEHSDRLVAAPQRDSEAAAAGELADHRTLPQEHRPGRAVVDRHGPADIRGERAGAGGVSEGLVVVREQDGGALGARQLLRPQAEQGHDRVEVEVDRGDHALRLEDLLQMGAVALAR